MAKRPSTLTVLRVFLDIWDELKNTSEHVPTRVLAERLQRKYQGKSEEERVAYFALPPDATLPDRVFPAQATVLRYIDYAEEDLRQFYPGQTLIPRLGRGDKSLLGRPTDEVTESIRDIIDGLFNQLSAVAGQKRTLHLAASDAVASFLLPRIDVAKAIGPELVLKIHPFRPRDIASELQARVIDFALAWDGYNEPVRTENLDARDIHDSRSEVRLLFSTQCQPLVNLWKKYLEENSEDTVGDRFVVEPDKLVGCGPLIYALDQLERVAQIIHREQSRTLAKGQMPIRLLSVDHLVSVVNAVRSNMGVGLCFGLPWMLDRMRHRGHILSARLVSPAESAKGGYLVADNSMGLKLYTRRGESSADPKSTAGVVAKLVTALEEMLANHGYPSPPMVEPNWRIEGPAKLPKDVSFGRPNEWYVYFVTGGRAASSIRPEWIFGRIEFTPSERGKPAEGTLYRGGSSAPFMSVWQVPGPDGEGCVMLRFKRVNKGKKLGEHTVAYFPARVANGTNPGRVILFGSLNFVVAEVNGQPAARPFASPIILTNQTLDSSEYMGIARSHLLHMLDGDDATPIS